MTGNATHWRAESKRRIRVVEDQLLETSNLLAQANADPDVVEMMLGSYRALLEDLFERDLPLAKLADESDLLFHIHGAAASAPSPRVSLVTRLLSQTRDQVTRLAKKLGGFETVRVPPALDLGFVGMASGSLFLGFSATDDATGSDLTRSAVEAITDASELVAGDRTLNDLAAHFDDPATRDIAVGAVRQLSPSGQIGISAIDVLGRRGRRSVSLTTETRRHARSLMAQPPTRPPSFQTFVGTVREVDLDASRFEIRNVEGLAYDIRCAHELEEAQVKLLVDQRVRVKGLAEYGRDGAVRMLWVDEVERLV